MPVTRNRVQELLKERASAIQQATFFGAGGGEAPVEVDLTALSPQDDPNHGGQMSIAWDDRVGDAVFYATVDADIKQYGYFQGDRQYDGGRDATVTDNAKVFDEMFGPDRAGFDRPVTEIVDVMPTVISKVENRKPPSLWEVPDDLTDPRDELPDTGYWAQLLRFLCALDGDSPSGLFSLVYGLRCIAAIGLESNSKGGVRVFSRDDREWNKARSEIMANKTWALNLNAALGQVK